jgi:hypothetical protein
MCTIDSIGGTQALSIEVTPMLAKETRIQGVLVGEIEEVEEASGGPSLVSIWKCPQCGCQIQVVIAPAGTIRQPFNCVDGTPMVAGKSH